MLFNSTRTFHFTINDLVKMAENNEEFIVPDVTSLNMNSNFIINLMSDKFMDLTKDKIQDFNLIHTETK